MLKKFEGKYTGKGLLGHGPKTAKQRGFNKPKSLREEKRRKARNLLVDLVNRSYKHADMIHNYLKQVYRPRWPWEASKITLDEVYLIEKQDMSNMDFEIDNTLKAILKIYDKPK